LREIRKREIDRERKKEGEIDRERERGEEREQKVSER